MSNAGDIFQQETKYYRGEMGGAGADRLPEPETYKQYPDCERIALP